MHNVSFWVSVCTSVWAGVFFILWLKKSNEYQRYRDMIDLRDNSRYHEEQHEDIRRSLAEQIDEIQRDIGGMYNEIDNRIGRNNTCGSTTSVTSSRRTKRMDL